MSRSKHEAVRPSPGPVGPGPPPEQKANGEAAKQRQILWMRAVMFWVFVPLFVVFCTFTTLAVFAGVGDLSEKARSTLFAVFIVEVGLVVIALFRSIFGLGDKSAGVLLSKRMAKAMEKSGTPATEWLVALRDLPRVFQALKELTQNANVRAGRIETPDDVATGGAADDAARRAKAAEDSLTEIGSIIGPHEQMYQQISDVAGEVAASLISRKRKRNG